MPSRAMRATAAEWYASSPSSDFCQTTSPVAPFRTSKRPSNVLMTMSGSSSPVSSATVAGAITPFAPVGVSRSTTSGKVPSRREETGARKAAPPAVSPPVPKITHGVPSPRAYTTGEQYVSAPSGVR